jgi:hypothetical protein
MRVNRPIVLPQVPVNVRITFVVTGNKRGAEWTFNLRHKETHRGGAIPGSLTFSHADTKDTVSSNISRWLATAADHHGVGNWSVHMIEYSNARAVFEWTVLGV